MRLIESFVTTSSTVQESGVNAEGSRFDLKKCDLNPGKLAKCSDSPYVFKLTVRVVSYLMLR